MEGVLDVVGHPEVRGGPPHGILLTLLQLVERIGHEEGGAHAQEEDQQDGHQLDQGRKPALLKRKIEILF